MCVWTRCASTARACSASHAATRSSASPRWRSEEHTSELQSQSNLVCRLLLEKKKKTSYPPPTTHCTKTKHSATDLCQLRPSPSFPSPHSLPPYSYLLAPSSTSHTPPTPLDPP